MKMSEIQVGKQYSVGYNTGVEVLEKNLERRNYSGNVRRDGVRVKVIEGYRAGCEDLIPSRDILSDWAEHKAMVEASRIRQEVMRRETERNQERAAQMREQFAEHGIQLGRISALRTHNDVTSDVFTLSLMVESDQMEKILELVKQAGDPGEVAAATAAGSSSALENLFG